MICIYCLHDKTTTPNSRPHKSRPVTWRRHRCPNCKGVFTTYERPSLEDMTIVADDQKRDPRMFSLGKLLQSIHSSLPPSDTRPHDSYELALSVEQHLIRKYDLNTPITKLALAQETHAILKRFDAVAGLQYSAQHQLITSIRRRGRPSTTATNALDASERA